MARISPWSKCQIFMPLFLLSATWDCLTSQLNASSHKISFQQALNKQTGKVEEPNAFIPDDVETPSENWRREHAIYQIETFKSEHLKDQNHKAAFTAIQTELRTSDKPPAEILKTHGLFATNQEETASSRFLSKLPKRISAPAAL